MSILTRSIPEIVDSHLAYWIKQDLNRRPIDKIEPEMSDPTQDIAEEWKIWLPIASKVTDSEISEFEEMIGHKFPRSYKDFLKYKHFYEIIIDQARFQHVANSWRLHLAELIYDTYDRELLIDKGYIPFADWSDWGLLCFDSNETSHDFDYPIILWDHDDWENYPKVYENFVSMMLDLDNKSQFK